MASVRTITRVAPFRFDRTFRFWASPERVWDELGHIDHFDRWWTWLHAIDTHGSHGLHPGARATCTIQSPLPYSLDLDINIERATRPLQVEASVRGDLVGPARLEIARRRHGSTARLAWDLDVADPVLRRLALVGRPLMMWAHDRVIAIGVEQFRRLALGEL